MGWLIEEEFKALSGAAQDAGVQNRMFGVFHDAGYKGLYGRIGRHPEAATRRPRRQGLDGGAGATEMIAGTLRMDAVCLGFFFAGHRLAVYHAANTPAAPLSRKGDAHHGQVFHCAEWVRPPRLDGYREEIHRP